MEPLRITSLNHATHAEPALKNNIQISLKQHALFQVWRSLIPKPPWSFVSTTVSHATLAELWLSIFPFHKNTLHREFFLFTHAFGRINAEYQKLVIPAITVLMRRSLPEKESDFTDQEENFDLIWWMSGSQTYIPSSQKIWWSDEWVAPRLRFELIFLLHSFLLN